MGLYWGALGKKYVVREAFCVSAIALTGWLTATCLLTTFGIDMERTSCLCQSSSQKRSLDCSECTKIIKTSVMGRNSMWIYSHRAIKSICIQFKVWRVGHAEKVI